MSSTKTIGNATVSVRNCSESNPNSSFQKALAEAVFDQFCYEMKAFWGHLNSSTLEFVCIRPQQNASKKRSAKLAGMTIAHQRPLRLRSWTSPFSQMTVCCIANLAKNIEFSYISNVRVIKNIDFHCVFHVRIDF